MERITTLVQEGVHPELRTFRSSGAGMSKLKYALPPRIILANHSLMATHMMRKSSLDALECLQWADDCELRA
jgi:hypothetical protein